MMLELAKPVALLCSILSLLGVFHAAFLEPASDVEQRLAGSLGPLLLAAGIALTSGLIFYAGSNRAESNAGRHTLNVDAASLIGTFPVRVFCWTMSGMMLLFILSWYLEAHCIFYRDVRF
jgi:hypothetical protein